MGTKWKERGYGLWAKRGKEMYYSLTEGDDFGLLGRNHCYCMAFIHGVREWGMGEWEGGTMRGRRTQRTRVKGQLRRQRNWNPSYQEKNQCWNF
jgi:hypothetical protein